MNYEEEEDILTYVATGECYYGAASKNKEVFRKDITFNVSWPAMAKDILRILELESQWKSEHISDLNKTILPYPGYVPYTINNEIHNDINHNYIFNILKKVMVIIKWNIKYWKLIKNNTKKKIK
ncbi:unnamed protein product [Cunninghamella echinulata]